MKSKSIKQIADEIGVSKATLQKRISRGSLYTRLYPYISMTAGTKYIDEIGENIIKEVFADRPSVKPVDSTGIDVDMDGYTRVHAPGIENDLVELLREQQDDLKKQLESKDKRIAELLDDNSADSNMDRVISMLQNELAEKDKQIASLSDTIRIQAQSIKNDTQNDLVENIVSAISKNELETKNNIIQELNKRVAELERMLAEPKNESAVTIIAEDINQADKKKKNGLLSRLFGKNKNSDNV